MVFYTVWRTTFIYHIMEIIFLLLVLIGSFILTAAIAYFLFRLFFPTVENDDLEERYVQMRITAWRLTAEEKTNFTHASRHREL